jgi:hypothetical protein
MGMSLGINRGMALNNTGGSSPSLASIFKAGDIGQLLLPQRAGSVYADELGTTSITSGAVGLILDQSLGIKTLSGWLGLDLTPDYWVDATNGDDSNAGTSEGAAWASLSKIGEIVLGANANVVVRVKRGTYDKTTDSVKRDDASSGGGVGLNATLTIVYESGCVMDGTAANAITPTDGHEFSGSNVWTAVIFGNNLQVNNYSEGTAASPNGVGNRGNHILHCWDVHTVNCDDGFSSHAAAQMYLYRCTAQDSEKSPFLHVDTCTVVAYYCEFTTRTGNIIVGRGSGTPSITMLDTKVIPGGTGTQVVNTTSERCHLGTTSARLSIVGGVATDCYVNNYTDGNNNVNLQRCYGRVSVRIRNGGAHVINRCIISGPATGQSSVVLSNSNFGAAQSLTFTNNIVETATAAAFMSVDAANAGFMVTAAQLFSNNILSGSAAFDADLIAADTGGTVIVDNVTADALIGAANTTNPADYGYASGSPAIGAGIGGINCGFSVADAAEIALAPAAVIGPDGVPGYHAKQATAADRPTLSATEVAFGAGESLSTTFPDLGADVTIAYADPGVGAVIQTGQTVGAGAYSGYVDNNGWLMIDRALTAGETALVEREFDKLAGV